MTGDHLKLMLKFFPELKEGGYLSSGTHSPINPQPPKPTPQKSPSPEGEAFAYSF